MKYINHISALVLVACLSLASCNTEKLQDLNINPQAVNEINMNFLFTAAQLSNASGGATGDNRYIDWRTNIGMFAYAIQQLGNAGGGIAPGDKYSENLETDHAPFFWLYGGQLKFIAEILKQTGPEGYDAGNKVNMRNASRIMKAWNVQRLTDYYGSVPYTEANLGIEGTFFPKYDKQQDIYPAVLQELEEACAAMSNGNPDEGFKNADLYFNGDADKWKRWGYSIMLRMAMRVSNVNPDLASQYVTKAVQGGVMTSNEDNVFVPMALAPSEWTNQNGISRAFFPGDGGQPSYLSATLVNWLKGTDQNSTADDDPRLMVISGGIADWTAAAWTPINTDPLAQKGLPNGYDQAGLDALEGTSVNQTQTYSRINVLMLDDDEPYMLHNYAEVEFLLAEAKERNIGNVSGTAEEHYKAGVKAAMQMFTVYDASLEVSDAAVDAYLATYPYGVTKPALEMIGEQMWASQFFNWWEAWSNWRRTGYPALTPTNFLGNLTNGQIPRRLRYPTQEVGGNPNYSSGATLPDDYLTRVWWDGGN
jgi:hypothetical protein